MQSDDVLQTDGLPSTHLVRGVMVALVAATLVGIYLLVATPTLPNERERTSAAPPATSAQPGLVRPGAPAASPDAAGSNPAAPAAAPGAAATAPTTAPPAARSHTIQPGDTLLAIAEQFDTTVDAIRAANPGLSETALQVGQEITIPGGR